MMKINSVISLCELLELLDTKIVWYVGDLKKCLCELIAKKADDGKGVIVDELV